MAHQLNLVIFCGQAMLA